MSDTTKLTVSLDTWVLGHARRVAAEQGTSFSAWLSEAAKWHVARHDFARIPDPTNDERFEAVRRQEAEEANAGATTTGGGYKAGRVPRDLGSFRPGL